MNYVYWNPWYGCHKCTIGCDNCYSYNRDLYFGKNPDNIEISKKNFKLPIEKDIYREFKIPKDSYIKVCENSDFFIEEANEWRIEAWKMIKERDDCIFIIETKRPENIYDSLPYDWGKGYKNVIIRLSIENQKELDLKLPKLLDLNIENIELLLSPLLNNISLEKYLSNDKIKKVIVCGDSHPYKARICDYDWIKDIHDQCSYFEKDFIFMKTGSNFKKDKKIYFIDKNNEESQAIKSNLNISF